MSFSCRYVELLWASGIKNRIVVEAVLTLLDALFREESTSISKPFQMEAFGRGRTTFLIEEMLTHHPLWMA